MPTKEKNLYCYPPHVREKAVKLREEGLYLGEIINLLQGPSYATLSEWFSAGNIVRGDRKKKRKKDNKFSFEEIKHLLFKHADRYKCNRFEKWELVNEVWIAGRAQNAARMEYVSMLIKYDMHNYMWDENRWNTPMSLVRNPTSLDDLYEKMNDMGSDRKFSPIDDLMSYENDEFYDKMEAKELWEYLQEVLPPRACKLLHLRFKEGLTFVKMSDRLVEDKQPGEKIALKDTWGYLAIELKHIFQDIRTILIERSLQVVV